MLLIGHDHHDETEGTLGHAPGRITLVRDTADAASVQVGDPTKVSYLMQTTLAVDEAAEVLDALRARFPALADPPSDDICYATTNRQQAVRVVARDSDVVLVLGSPNSSNSVRLVEVAEREGAPAYLVEDADAIRPEWLAGAAYGRPHRRCLRPPAPGRRGRRHAAGARSGRGRGTHGRPRGRPLRAPAVALEDMHVNVADGTGKV